MTTSSTKSFVSLLIIKFFYCFLVRCQMISLLEDGITKIAKITKRQAETFY